MPDLGPVELGVILLIVVMIFGAGKLPQVATSLGKAIKEFKKSSDSDDSAGNETAEATPRKKARRAKIKPYLVAAMNAGPRTATEFPPPAIASAIKPKSVERPVHAA